VTQLLDSPGPGPDGASRGAALSPPAADGADRQAPGATADRLAPGAAADRLAGLVAVGGLAILSGAGLSTESGIPDYRGPTGLARRAGTPMTYQVFTGSAAARQRYWARSHLGWGQIAGAEPNAGHRAVAELGRRGRLTGIITQNVDGLHQAAGAGPVIELHGSLSRVRCLGCGERTPRLELDRRLREANWAWSAGPAVPLNPDGDAELGEEQVRTFRVVDCAGCGGLLMPDVVFFGENVPRPRVDTCFALVGQSAALVVLGSSLTVMSGFRFVRHAARLGVPVAIVNQGATRGDQYAALTLDAPLGATLAELVRRTT
jgi:NAD-dependent SIR2 family protein deacetylase